MITKTAASTFGRGWKLAAGEAPAPAEPPPWTPGCADQIGGPSRAHLGSVAGDLPLDDEVGPDEGTAGVVEQPAQNRGRRRKRRVGDHPVGVEGKRHHAGVAAEHGHVRHVRKPAGQSGRERVVELQREHGRGSCGQRGSEHTGPRAEIDDAVVGADVGVGDKSRRELWVTEEMLTEPA